jgi:bis(5'-nucleosyl)-tetraphosphatase (symmetrical)
MTTYVIGDLQGCYDEFNTLLAMLNFDPVLDRLWLVGDLVNRGPKSLEVLRAVRAMGATSVLGNHDLHLLATWYNQRRHFKQNDTIGPIMSASDGGELIEWLRHRPLLHHDAALDATLIHAGLPPQWDLATAKSCAAEVEEVLRGKRIREFLGHMYGNKPDKWSPKLKGWDRLRYIVNCFTRLRYIRSDGTLEFKNKLKPGSENSDIMPWFKAADRRSAGERIIFGHWSTLGLYLDDNVRGIDTGCLWGGKLTALHLDGATPGSVTQFPCPINCPIESDG